MNDTLIISIILFLIDNTFNLQLHQVHNIPVVNTMLHKTLTIEIANHYLVITDDEQYYSCPIDTDITKCLVSKGHYCSY